MSFQRSGCNFLVSPLGLAAFRILFGAIMLVSTLRFWARGWIDELLLKPTYHFPYWGFEWVVPWPGAWMYAHVALMVVSAVTLTLGFWSKSSALVFGLLFTYVELIDQTTYLNHYYLVTILSMMLATLPSGAALSLDARRGPGVAIPGFALVALRVQVGLVYFFAGLAKLNADWLFRAEPLSTWLAARADWPLIGPVLGFPSVAFVMSWAGAVYNLTLPFLLSWPRLRPWAFGAAACFHLAVWALFPIGVFSFLMIACTTVFFDPDWPTGVRTKIAQWLSRKDAPAPISCAVTIPRWTKGLLVLHLALQMLLPLRHLLYPGSVLWTEEGFRFSWRVMLIEKTGSVEYQVESSCYEQPVRIHPRFELTPLQFKMMSTQPEMIHRYALHIAALEEAKGCPRPRVRVEAWVSLNGRPSARVFDPAADLAAVPVSLRPNPHLLPYP